MPECFINAMCRAVEGLKNETPDVRAQLAYLAWVQNTKHRQHRDFDGYMAITYQELYRRFGRGQFSRINGRLAMFEYLGESRERGASRAYRLTHKAAAAKRRYLHTEPGNTEKTVRMVTMNGLHKLTPPRAIVGKTRDGVTLKVWQGMDIPNVVCVDIPRMKRLYAQLSAKASQIRSGHSTRELFPGKSAHADSLGKLEYRRDMLAQLLRLARTEMIGPSYIPHRWRQASTGRLYALGISLQNAPKAIKQAALHGLWDYDFENCHYSIFYQMARNVGCECEYIAAYLKNKRAVRLELMARNGLSQEEAKGCLLAIMYGARTNQWHEGALRKTLGDARAEALARDPMFAGMQGDIERGTKAIITGWKDGERDTIRNAVECSTSRSQAHKFVMAHLLQGEEARMLRIVMQLYPGEVVLLMHDGFVTRSQLDTERIERAIRDQTTFDMRLSEERIQVQENIAF